MVRDPVRLTPFSRLAIGIAVVAIGAAASRRARADAAIDVTLFPF